MRNSYVTVGAMGEGFGRYAVVFFWRRRRTIFMGLKEVFKGEDAAQYVNLLKYRSSIVYSLPIRLII